MTLPIIESLGSHPALYLVVLVNVSNPVDASCWHFFSINMPSYFHPGPQENTIWCPEVSAVEASDSSWKVKVWSCLPRTWGVDNTTYPVASVLYSAANIVAAMQIILSNSESSDSMQTFQFKKKANSHCLAFKTLIIRGLSAPVIAPLHHSDHRVGWTLAFDYTESADVFLLCKPAFMLTNQQ